jgi:hypothetical protein
MTDQTSNVRVFAHVRYRPPFIQQNDDDRSTDHDVFEPRTREQAYQTVGTDPTHGAGVLRIPTVTCLVPEATSRKTGFWYGVLPEAATPATASFRIHWSGIDDANAYVGRDPFAQCHPPRSDGTGPSADTGDGVSVSSSATSATAAPRRLMPILPSDARFPIRQP